MSKVRIDYHNGQSEEFCTAEVIPYQIVPPRTPNERERIETSHEKKNCSYEFLVQAMIHEWPLVLKDGKNGEFSKVISTRGVKSIVNLETLSERKTI